MSKLTNAQLVTLSAASQREDRGIYRAARMASEALLVGRIFDDRGNRMSPSHSGNGAASAKPRKVKDDSDGARKPNLYRTAWWGW
jgi:hypothetical protein